MSSLVVSWVRNVSNTDSCFLCVVVLGLFLFSVFFFRGSCDPIHNPLHRFIRLGHIYSAIFGRNVYLYTYIYSPFYTYVIYTHEGTDWKKSLESPILLCSVYAPRAKVKVFLVLKKFRGYWGNEENSWLLRGMCADYIRGQQTPVPMEMCVCIHVYGQ